MFDNRDPGVQLGREGREGDLLKIGRSGLILGEKKVLTVSTLMLNLPFKM